MHLGKGKTSSSVSSASNLIIKTKWAKQASAEEVAKNQRLREVGNDHMIIDMHNPCSLLHTQSIHSQYLFQHTFSRCPIPSQHTMRPTWYPPLNNTSRSTMMTPWYRLLLDCSLHKEIVRREGGWGRCPVSKCWLRLRWLGQRYRDTSHCNIIHMHTYIHTYTYPHTHTHIHTYTYLYTHIHTYTYLIHTYTYLHTHIPTIFTHSPHYTLPVTACTIKSSVLPVLIHPLNPSYQSPILSSTGVAWTFPT